MSYSASLDYPLEIEGEIFYPGNSKELWEERQAGKHRRADWAWRWSKKLFQFGYDNGFIVVKRKKDGTARIYTKTYLNAKIGKDSNGNFFVEYNKRVKATSSIEYIDNKYSNDNAKKDLSVFGLGDKFDYSKPVELIKKLVKAYYKNDALILDFFAGSGTTAQAVLELNAEDGGNRRFIVCTNNENNICQEVTYQRIKTILTGIMASGSEYQNRVKGNLKYYKIDFVEKESDELTDELHGHTEEMIQLEYGISIHNSQYVIVMDDDEMDDLENNFSSYKDLKAVFLNRDVLLSASQERMLKDIDTFIIPDYEFYEIPEDDVINEGLITSAIYVNEGVDERKQITNDYEYLLELADKKRKEIQAGYDTVKANIRPLVLIQFPMGQPETVAGVEAKLKGMGYTYDNGMVAIWMSDAKKNIDNLTVNDGSPVFLLMKQAISTGWDCPRAKILVKLREGGSEDFQIQTIGRIRRMPEKKHYGLNVLDYCYIYTLDSNYKMDLLSSMDKAYQVRRLFLRDEAKNFVLTKELPLMKLREQQD